MDDRIKKCIRTAVSEEGQPDHVADKLIKWFENVANGNESIGERSAYRRRAEGLYDSTDVDVED